MLTLQAFSRTKIVLLSLQSAPVPWSPTIEQICVEGKKFSTSDVIALIEEQEKLVVLKQVFYL